jgi:ketosteroid isomerase-like protein
VFDPACDHAAMSTRNEDLVREFFATLSTGDLEALRKLIHPDGSWEVMSTAVPGAGLTSGGDAVIDDFLKPVRGMFEPGDPKIHVKRTFCDGNIVGAETEGIGELANGNHYHNRYAWVIEIKDDKVCHLREYMDTAYILSVV